MMKTFQTQDAYGAAVHMDSAYFHVFLIGTRKKLEYLRLPSSHIGIHVKDLIKHVAAMRDHSERANPSKFSRKIHVTALHSRDKDGIKDMSWVLRVLWEVLVRPIVQALQLKVSHHRCMLEHCH
jgi:hypothetical protein